MNPQVPTNFSTWPVQASKIAGDVDLLYIAMIAVSTLFTVGIIFAIIVMAVKYRRRPGNEGGRRVPTSTALELTWTIIPFFIVIGMFFWGSKVYFEHITPNPNALEILTTGKKWMWKFQHKNGRREINDLHIPVNTPIRLKMASEDVIHCVFIPAFRQKQDVMPGRYSFLNLEANKVGVYHLFCNQYCGTQHANMIGKVVVMEPGDYQKWLGGFTGDSPEKVGEALFSSLACNTCHTGDNGARGPMLNGLIGSKVGLQGGNVIVADDNYIRESVLNPQAKVVLGYQPIMPSFQGVVSQDQINALIAYIKTLPAPTGAPAASSAVSATEGATSTSAEATSAPAPVAPAEASPAAPVESNNKDTATTSGPTADSVTSVSAAGSPSAQESGVN